MKKRILVVSQKNYIRNLLKTELKEEGYGVLMADTGREAIGQLRRHPADLVLIDTILSDIDGEEILSYLEKATAPPPVVIWSAPGRDFWSLGTYILKTANFFKIKTKIKELCPSVGRAMQCEKAVGL